MTDRAQFEAMLNALINEDQEAAKEIFHNIVVAKSREIYEELLAEDFSEEEEESATEGAEEEEEGMEENFGAKPPKDTGNPYASDEEEEGEEEEGAGEEEEGSEEEGGEEGEGDIEDRVMDLEDALEDLKAEFEALLADEEHEPEHHDGQDDPDFGAMGGDEFGGDMGGEEEMDEFAGLMEYTIKVPTAKMGDNGANTKSAVAGKNDMGGTTANIAQGHEEKAGGTKGGLLNPSTKEENFGNINVPGGKAGKTAFTKKEPGHGAEKKGAAEKADNKNSMLNGAPGRAK
jgi:hypothetical protein